MPLALEIEGLENYDVEVEDSFADLSEAQQQEYVASVISQITGGTLSGVGQFTSPFESGADQEYRGFAPIESIIAGAERFIGSSATGLGAVVDYADVLPGLEKTLSQAGRDIQEEYRESKPIKPLLEAEDVGDVASSSVNYIAENTLPIAGSGLAAAVAAGAARGLRIPGPPILKGIAAGISGLAAGAGTLWFDHAGQMVNEIQEQTGKQELTEDEQERAFLGATANAAVDSLLGKLVVARGSPGLMKNIMTKGGAGIAIEVPTEVFQEANLILTANDYDFDALTTPESVYRLKESALAAAAIGGGLGGISGLRTDSPAPTTQQGQQAASLAQQTTLAEFDVLQNKINEVSDPTSDVDQEIASVVQEYLGRPGPEQTVQSVINRLEEKTKEAKLAVKNAERTGQSEDVIDSLRLVEENLKASTAKVKGLAPAIQKSFQIQADDIVLGEQRDPTLVSALSAKGGITPSMARYASQGVAPMAAGAAKNSTIRELQGLFTGFFPAVTNRSAGYIKDIYDAKQALSRSVKIPILQDETSSRTEKILTEILFNNDTGLGQNVSPARARTVLDNNNVKQEDRQAFIDSASSLKLVQDRIFSDAVDNGLLTPEEYRSGYFHVEHNWIGRPTKRKAAVDSISKVAGVSRAQAEQIVDNINADVTGQTKMLSASDFIRRGNVATATRRVAGFEKNRTLPDKIIRQLMADDLINMNAFRNTTRYAQQAAHSIETKRRFGDKDPDNENQFSKLLNGLKIAIGDDPDIQAALERAEDLYSAIQGSYSFGKRPYSTSTKRKISGALTFEYLVTLGGASLSAIVEPLVILTDPRFGTTAFAVGTMKAVQAMYRKLIRSVFPRLEKNEAEKAFDEILYGISPILSERMIATSTVDVSNIFTEKFFLLNFLSQITQFNRAMAYFGAKYAIDRDMTIVNDPSSSASKKKWAALRLKELGIKDTINVSEERMNIARIRAVDNVVMNPNVVNRPLWMSEPVLSLLGQLSSFMFAFGNNVGSRAASEMFRGRTVEGDKLDVQEYLRRNMTTLVGFTLLVGATLYMQTVKDAIRNWDDEKEDYPEKNLDFFIRGLASTNILGAGTKIVDMLYAKQFGAEPVSVFLGPSVSDANRIVSAISTYLTTGNAKPLARELARHVPLAGINPSFRRWVASKVETDIKNGQIDLQSLIDKANKRIERAKKKLKDKDN